MSAAALLLAAEAGAGFGFTAPGYGTHAPPAPAPTTASFARAVNPHLSQLSDDEPFPSPLPALALPRLLHPLAPAAHYRRRGDELKSVVHWGQRKLALSEIEFIVATLGARSSAEATLVYAGAAPGTHIPFLAQLFPSTRFVCIDPGDFSIPGTARVGVRREYMTAAVAAEWAPGSVKRRGIGRLLFVSDVRTADFRVMDDAAVEAAVRHDMQCQSDWVRIMQPDAALLKFRLPWEGGLTPYLEGAVLLPVHGPPTTTEGRLLVVNQRLAAPTAAPPPVCDHSKATGAQQRGSAACPGFLCCGDCALPSTLWDNDVYNSQMFYHNLQTRLRTYDHAAVPRCPSEGAPTLSTSPAECGGVASSEDCVSVGLGGADGSNCCVQGVSADASADRAGLGLDACYDCAAEIHILSAYLRYVGATCPHCSSGIGGSDSPTTASLGSGTASSLLGGGRTHPSCPAQLRSLVDALSVACSPHTGRTLATQSDSLPSGEGKAVWFPSKLFDARTGVVTLVEEGRRAAAFVQLSRERRRGGEAV